MKEIKIEKGTKVRLLDETESLACEYWPIPAGTYGTVIDFVRDVNGDIDYYYIMVHGVWEEELYFDRWDFEVVSDFWGRSLEYEDDEDEPFWFHLKDEIHSKESEDDEYRPFWFDLDDETDLES